MAEECTVVDSEYSYLEEHTELVVVDNVGTQPEQHSHSDIDILLEPAQEAWTEEVVGNTLGHATEAAGIVVAGNSRSGIVAVVAQEDTGIVEHGDEKGIGDIAEP